MPSASRFLNSHRWNPCFRNSHLRNFSRIQAPLIQTPLRLPPTNSVDLAAKLPNSDLSLGQFGDTISCVAPYSAIGFRGKFFLRCPPCQTVFGLRQSISTEKSGGVAATVRDTTGNTVREYCLHVSRDRGGIPVRSLRFGVFFFLLLCPKKKAQKQSTKKAPQKSPRHPVPEIWSEKFPSDFCRSLSLTICKT